MEYKISEYANIMLGYREDSILKPRPFYHTGIEESLENIVLKEEPETKKDAVDKVFSDKGRTLKATVKALFNEIMLRERLDSFLLYDMNQGICKQHNYLESIKELHRFSYFPELLKDFHEKKMKLEDNVLGLEKEKRKEYLECWRDLMALKKYLLSALKDYWNLNSRKSFLDIENDKSGHRNHMQEAEAYTWKQGR